MPIPRKRCNEDTDRATRVKASRQFIRDLARFETAPIRTVWIDHARHPFLRALMSPRKSEQKHSADKHPEPGLKVEQWPIERFRDYERNPRKNDDSVDRMCAAIREFGFRIPIVAKSDGLVVDGHLRLKAARKLGLKTLPAALADELTDAQIKAFRLLANKSASWAEWDDDLLKIEFAELKALDFDLTLTGFTLDAIGDLMNPPTPGQSGAGSLADKFMVVPFSVLNAREGWWQDRKRAWLALGIQSELGRGENALDMSASMAGIDNPEAREAWNEARRKLKGANTPHEGAGMADGLVSLRAKQKAANATPGGALMPAADYSKRQRGDGTGRAIGEE